MNQSSALVGTVDNMLVDLNLSNTNGSSRARTWTPPLTDEDANHYAISRPPMWMLKCVAYTFKIHYEDWYNTVYVQCDHGVVHNTF